MVEREISLTSEQGDEVSQERLQELEATLESLREDSEVAYVLLGLAGALAEVRSVEDTLALATRTVPGLFGAERAFAAVWDGTSERFLVTSHHGYSPEEERGLLESAREGADSYPFLLQALEQRTPVLVSDVAPMEGRAVIAIPLIRWGKDFGGLRIEFPEPRTFSRRDEFLAQGVARQVGVALDNARRFNLLQGLSRFSERIASHMKQQQVLDEVLAGTSDLLTAEGVWLYFHDPAHGVLLPYAGRSSSLALPERLARLNLDEEPWSDMAGGGTIAVADVSTQFGRPDLTALAAPLRWGNQPPIGCLLVVYEQGHPFGAEDVEALNVLAAQAGQAIETSRRLDRERSVARSLQAGLLSSELPEIPGFQASAIYEAADEEADVGGDFFDVLELPEARFGIVVGDVSGKGAAAAAQMAMVKYMLRAFAIRNPTPGSVLHHLNNALERELPEDRFTTLVYAVLDTRDRTIAVSLAGHPTPLVARASGEIEVIETPGTILGAFPDQSYGHVTFTLEPGDSFLAYTDGLLEARKDDDLYGRPRIEESLKRRFSTVDPGTLARAIYDDARAFGRVTDDTVVLSLCCTRED